MKKGRILLVEDDPDDVLLMKIAFKEGNIANEIVVTRDGVEALEFLRGEGDYKERDTGNLPEVVLLDLKMPRMGGIEFLKIIRQDERTKHLPVVVLTSSKEEQDIMDSYDFGANSYVHKPVDINQFSEAIKNLGLYWLVLNLLPKE